MIIFEEFGIDMGYVLLGTIGVMLIMLVLIIVALVKHRKLKKKYNAFMQGEDAKSLETVIQTRFQEIDQIKERMFVNDQRLDSIDKFLYKCYNNSRQKTFARKQK